MVPPRSPFTPRSCSSLPFIHSVIRPTTGSDVAPNSVEFASSMPQRLRAASMTAIVGDAAVGERLDERLISVLEAGIFTDNGNRHIAFRIANAFVDEPPAREIRLAFRLDPERHQHFTIEPRLVIG